MMVKKPISSALKKTIKIIMIELSNMSSKFCFLKPNVLGCCRYCGGLGDRVKGLMRVLSYAITTTQQFTISDGLFVSSVCGENIIQPNKVPDISNLTTLLTEWCSGKDGHYKCGSFILHYSGLHSHLMATAYHYATKCITVFSDGIVLHSRVGGSSLSIGSDIRGVPWGDGYNTTVPNTIIAMANTMTGCRKRLVVLSDSSLFVAIMMQMEGVYVTSCCGSPQHISHRRFDSDLINEFVSLAIISQSKYIYRTMGGFTRLGRYLYSWNPQSTYLYSNTTGALTLSKILQCNPQ